MSEMELPELPSTTAYARWVERQKVPLWRGYHIDDINEFPVGDWPRLGVRGAIAELEGSEGLNDAQVLEIPPGGDTIEERHLYEKLVYVVKGRGSSQFRNDSGHEVSFEWGEGSLFSVPLNARHRHFNGSGTSPARFYMVTNAPLILNLFHNDRFVFENDFEFPDRFGESAFTAEGQEYRGRVWDANFIPNLHELELRDWKARGAGGTNMQIEMSDSSMCAHVSEFPVGTYKKAHRHGAGAHVIILDGKGYDLLWYGEGDPKRIDWHPGSVIVPPERHWHQHFNTGDIPAKYLALRWGSNKYPVFKIYKLDYSHVLGGDQIEYEHEEPWIREAFEAELAAAGVESRMTPFFSEHGA